MRKRLRLHVLTGCLTFLLAPEVLVFGQETQDSRIQIAYSNGRVVVRNAELSNGSLMISSPTSAPLAPQELTLDRNMPAAIQSLVHSISRSHGVDPLLVAAVMKVESNYNRWARSAKGALGLMQLIPATGARFGVQDFFDPAQNIEGGVRYLRFLAEKFGATNLDLLLAAYNAGENLVARVGGVPAIRETRDYVRKIRTIYKAPAAAVLTAAAPVSEAPTTVTALVEPEAPPPPTIYKSVDARGVIHFSNIGPPN